MFQEENESEDIHIHMGKLWMEIKEWRKHWRLSSFFNVLILGLAASLFDSGTDFNIAASVPAARGNTTECGVQDFHLTRISSPCGMFHYKEVRQEIR